ASSAWRALSPFPPQVTSDAARARANRAPDREPRGSNAVGPALCGSAAGGERSSRPSEASIELTHRRVHVTGAEGNDDIAAHQPLLDGIGELLLVLDVRHVVVPVLANRLCELLRRYPVDRAFTGGVNVGDEEHVGLVESAGKPVEQVASAGVSM